MQRNRQLILRAIGLVGAVFLVGVLELGSGPAGAESDRETESPGTLEFVGKNAFATANGMFHDWRVVESSIDPTALSESFAIIEVDLASVDTGSNRRDNHLRDPDFFEVETYPVAKIRVHSAHPNGQTETGRPRFSVQFDIDLHGVQKTLEGEVAVVDEESLVFEGSLVLDRIDFGVGAAPSRWNPMSVKAAIPIRFRVEF